MNVMILLYMISAPEAVYPSFTHFSKIKYKPHH